jgi:hypothetical protein
MPRFQVDNTLQTLHLLSSQGFQQVTTPFNRTVVIFEIKFKGSNSN